MAINKKLLSLLLVLLCLSPLGYLWLVWDGVPASVPVHFGSSEEGLVPDRYAPRNELWTIAGVMCATAIFSYFLLRNLHRIDPKRSGANNRSTTNKLAAGLAVLLTLLNYACLIASTRTDMKFPLHYGILILVGLLFAFLGNFMNNLKPNHFVGLRLPWTLANDENWRATHRLAARIWFWGGVVMIFGALVIPPAFAAYLILGTVAVLIIVPSVYSFRHYQQMQKRIR